LGEQSIDRPASAFYNWLNRDPPLDGVVYVSVFNVLVHMFNIGDDFLGPAVTSAIPVAHLAFPSPSAPF
jgi:hypothetical protein